MADYSSLRNVNELLGLFSHSVSSYYTQKEIILKMRTQNHEHGF